MKNRIRIAKVGYSALSDPDPNHMVYDSEYDTLKYHIAGTKQLVVSGADTETTQAHNLGYIPFFAVYVNDPVNTSRFAMCPFVFDDAGFYTLIDAYADSTNIYFTVNTNSLNATLTFYYKVFRNNTEL